MTMIYHAAAPPAPLPIRELESDHFRTDARLAGEIDIYGRCAPWCNVNEDPAQREATSVAEHGPWCSVGHGQASGVDLQGSRFEIYTGLAQFYAHGTYRAGSLAGRNEPVVRLSLLGKGIEPDPEDSECKSVQFTPGEARHLAAILVYLADESERLNEPIASRVRG